MLRLASLLLSGCLLTFPAALTAAEPIHAESVLIRLIEEVAVPAQEEGVLAKVMVQEGMLVKQGEMLAQIDDQPKRVELDHAQTEVAIADRKAGNDVSVRFAKKAAEVAHAELARAQESIQKYPKSISDTELDRLRLTLDRSKLEIEQAEHLLEIERLTRQLKQQEYSAAKLAMERRQILSPIDGVVVEVNARAGEWVEPGEKVLRVLRLDRLRAEGFLNTSQLRPNLVGAAAQVLVDLPGEGEITFAGRITFISPEVDPVNNQVRIWVEIENPELKLRPGLRAKMQIK